MPSRKLKLLVVDDEASMRHMLRLVLEKDGAQVLEASGAQQALDHLAEQTVQAVLCDIRMPEMDGLTLLPKMLELQPGLIVIMMSAYGSVERAIECLKKGAYDYIAKPFQADEVVLTVHKAMERLSLEEENRQLRRRLGQSTGAKPIAASPGMRQVLALIERAALSDLPILIRGETGTGKEVVAQYAHQVSPRAKGPMVSINCGAISPQLIESELFGHVKGAFTGAERHHDGLFVSADGGTLFLDEIGELPLELQPKLLRVLQEGVVRRVGDTRPRRVDVRVLAATARDLAAEAEAGRFRQDLYYRLNAIDVVLPPLRERGEDVAPLARFFARQAADRYGCATPELTDEAVRSLQARSWPGNIRELQNYMEKVLLFHRGAIIDSENLPEEGGSSAIPSSTLSLKQATIALEVDHIRRALELTDGNRTQAAQLLEISLRSLQYKIKDYHLGE